MENSIFLWNYNKRIVRNWRPLLAQVLTIVVLSFAFDFSFPTFLTPYRNIFANSFSMPILLTGLYYSIINLLSSEQIKYGIYWAPIRNYKLWLAALCYALLRLFLVSYRYKIFLISGITSPYTLSAVTLFEYCIILFFAWIKHIGNYGNVMQHIWNKKIAFTTFMIAILAFNVIIVPLIYAALGLSVVVSGQINHGWMNQYFINMFVIFVLYLIIQYLKIIVIVYTSGVLFFKEFVKLA